MILEKIEARIPEEPLAGSVVLSNAGMAWQHQANGFWYSATDPTNARRWWALIAKLGSVTLIHLGTGTRRE